MRYNLLFVCAMWHIYIDQSFADNIMLNNNFVLHRRIQEFPHGGAPTYYLYENENEEKRTGGGARPKFYYVDQPMFFYLDHDISCYIPDFLNRSEQ